MVIGTTNQMAGLGLIRTGFYLDWFGRVGTLTIRLSDSLNHQIKVFFDEITRNEL